MKKILKISIYIIFVLIITSCDVNKKKKNKAIIKSIGGGLSVVTCYQDSKGNERCVAEDIGLYVEYKNEELTINDALKQNLITLDDVEEAYKKYTNQNYNVNKKTIDDKKIEELRKTTKIIIEDSLNDVIINTIDDMKKINEIIGLISNCEELSKGSIVTTELYTWIVEMYDENEQLIDKVYIWKSGCIGFNEAKEYTFNSNDLKILKEIIENDI